MQYCIQAKFQVKHVSVLCGLQAMFVLPDIWHSLYVCRLSMRTGVRQLKGLAAQDGCDTDRRQSVPSMQCKVVDLAVIRQAKTRNEVVLGM